MSDVPALLTRLRLLRCQAAYIATPLYHGYGIAILLLCIALGKKVVLTPGFSPAKACALIQEHAVDIVTVVPTMLAKMLKQDAAALKSLSCIASGGATLSPKLVAEVFGKLGPVLYNLYGTSEAGLNLIATPQDLQAASQTIGKKISSARLQVRDHRGNKLGVGEIGQICIKNRWSMRNWDGSWIETGDLGYRDERGYYFLCGRTDEMIVSGGVNVYPLEVEQMLSQHPLVEDVAVIGVPDEMYGQRLRAFVQPVPHADASAEALLDWLRPRVARHQLPREIVFVDRISYTHAGKRDKKRLRQTGE
ncbi:long-chain fatty acid--CoA ligase [Brevibacillus composti]|uniref:Long-chain fatty acid--CoA ligase n=1 Tax=Brevibacillus composti TaxID=2796470 RepID=A0A7T5EJ58_9BACL|nr:fatty acid--CoA ligase family protein [Brevibacillus composti]QQE73503.1 long-chain fatty acid--CoA ligase [Brevibacillus composti]QUO40585.1 long-chain fatty acid--CoA ligase [Brevibacillus composti]